MQGFLSGAGVLGAYLAIAASAAMICRRFLKIPDEVFRKSLHFILLGAYIPFVFAFETWWSAVLAALAIEVAAYPALAWGGRFPKFSAFVNERRSGEFKSSLVLACSMLSVCIAVCWGWLGDRYMVLACMYAWGVGDAFAALCGKAFGKHKVKMKFVDPRKSVEGSCAMFVTSALAVLIVLVCRGGMSPAGYVLIPTAGAAAATMVELISTGGLDTITCPSAAMAVILPLTALLGGFA